MDRSAKKARQAPPRRSVADERTRAPPKGQVEKPAKISSASRGVRFADDVHDEKPSKRSSSAGAAASSGAGSDRNAAFFSMLEEQRVVPRGFAEASAAGVLGNGYEGMPPEDGDSDPEDAEIRYLESKLGLGGAKDPKSSKKNEKKLRREYKMDGLGEGFFDFLSACDTLSSRLSAKEQADADAAAAAASAEEYTPLFGGNSASEDEMDDAARLQAAMDAAAAGADSSDDDDFDDGDLEGDSEGGLDASTGEEDAAAESPSSDEDDTSSEESGGSAAEDVARSAAQRRRAKFASLYGDAGPRESHSDLGVEAKRPEDKFEEFGSAGLAGGDDGKAEEGAPAAQGGGGYIPPSLRRRMAAAAGASGGAEEARRSLERKVQGLFNKVAATNVEGVLGELCALPAFGPEGGVGVGAMNDALTTVVLQMCADDVAVLRSLIMVYAALIAGAHIRMGVRIGAKILEAAVLRLQKAAKLPHSATADAIQEYVEKTVSDSDAKEARNLMLLLSYLYLFGVAHADLVLDVLHLCSHLLREHDVDLLHVTLKHCGFQLRSDDAVALKALLDTLSAAVEGDASVSTRVRVMVDLTTDIRNNRKRQTTQQLEERGTPLRKWLGRMASAGGSSQERRLRVRWHDIMLIAAKGRWWLVGSSWAGRDSAMEDGAVRTSTAQDTAGGGISSGGGGNKGPAAAVDENEALLLKVAAKMHMNTDIKKRVFVALMGASDPEDAVSRVLTLNLRGTADREIVRVLVDCTGQEKAFNPFYAAVGVRLCKLRHAFKFTFQLCLWDNVKAVDTLTTRRIYNLARLMAALIHGQALSIAVFKVFNFAHLAPKTLLWLRATVDSMLNSVSDDAGVVGMFSRCGTGRDVMLVRDGMTLFLSKYMKAHVALTYERDAKKRQLLKQRLKIARRTLDGVRASVADDDDMF